MSTTNTPRTLKRNGFDLPISALQSVLSPTEINQKAGVHPNVGESSNNDSDSPISSVWGFGASKPKQVDDDIPTESSVLPQHRDIITPTVSYKDNQPIPPPPPRPSLIECMCCGFSTTYNIYNEQQLSKYLHYTRKVKNSNLILLLLVAFLALPISSIYFGLNYKGSCPMVQFSPLLLIIMGIVGVIFIIVRLMTISTRRHLWNLKEPPQILSISLTLMLMIFMTMEMIRFYAQKPDFSNPKNPVFCEKAFYNYVFYINFVVLVILILALLFHIPVKTRSPVQIATREHFVDI